MNNGLINDDLREKGAVGMENKHNRLIFAAAVAVVLIIAAFLIGTQIGSSKAYAEHQEIEEKHITWNRSELKYLLGTDETIYVAGHKSPDTDAVCSAILYANLLQELGYDAQPVVLGEINNETKYVLETAGVEEPPLLEDASGKTMVLVDHSDYQQSADGIEDANIIMIIDHHGDGTVITGNQIVYDARPYGSTATIIGVRYINYGIEIDPQTAMLMLAAILSDTKNLQSDNTTPADSGALEDLKASAGIEDVDAFYQDMYKALISYEGKTDEDIFFSDYKEYESSGTPFAIACVDVYDEDEAKLMAERMKKVFPSVLPSIDMDIVIVQVSVFHDGLSLNYLVPANDVSAEVLEAALEGQAVFDGTSYVLKPGVSRRQVLVPAISDVLEWHPKE